MTVKKKRMQFDVSMNTVAMSEEVMQKLDINSYGGFYQRSTAIMNCIANEVQDGNKVCVLDSNGNVIKELVI